MKDLNKNDDYDLYLEETKGNYEDEEDIVEGNGLPDELVGDMMMEFCEDSIPNVLEHFKELSEDQERLEDEIMAFHCFLCEVFAIININDGDYIRYRFIKQFSPNRKKSTFSCFINNRVEMYHEMHTEKKSIGIWDCNKNYYSDDNFILHAITILGDMIYYPDSKSITTYDEYLITRIPIRDYDFQFKIQLKFQLFMMFKFHDLIECLETIIEPLDKIASNNDNFDYYDDDN